MATMKTNLGLDGYDYPYTSTKLVRDQNGKTVEQLLEGKISKPSTNGIQGQTLLADGNGGVVFGQKPITSYTELSDKPTIPSPNDFAAKTEFDTVTTKVAELEEEAIKVTRQDVASVTVSMELQDTVNELKETLTTIDKITKNKFIEETVTKRIFINPDGTVVSNAGYSTSDYIHCSGYVTVSVQKMLPTAFFRVAIYDSNKTFVKREATAGKYLVLNYSDNYYIRVVTQNDGTSDVQVEDGKKPTTYFKHDTNTAIDLIARDCLGSIKKKKPIFSLVDDDTTSLELVESYHNILSNNDVIGNFAVVTSNLDSSAELKNKLLEYEEEGYGLYLHCNTHDNYFRPDTENRDIVEVQKNVVKGLRKMRNFGFCNYNIWITPFGVKDENVQTIARRHGLKALLSNSNKTYVKNEFEFGRYEIPRSTLYATDDNAANYTIDDLKATIDECVTNNGWIIITTHVNEFTDQSSYTRLDTIIKYCKSKGMECKNLSDALEIMRPYYVQQEIKHY